MVNIESNKLSSKKKKILYLDIIRIFACFFVIINHTNSKIFLGVGESTTWWLSLTYFFISKSAVPLFFMISGITLLTKEDSYKKSFKRLFRVLIDLIVFSMLYYLNLCYKEETFSLGGFFFRIYNDEITGSYWYLYLYLAILIMMPLLQKFIKSLNKKDILYYLFFTFLVCGSVPILNHYFPKTEYNKNFSLMIFNGYIGYMFLGYYIEKYIKINKKIFISSIFIYIISIFVNVVATYFEKIKYGESYLFFDNRILINIAIPSVCFFIICKYIFENKIKFKENTKKIILEIGTCTFGIYLLSDLLICSLTKIEDMLFNKMYCMLAVLIYEVVVFMTGLFITFLLRKIPFIKKYI